MRGNRRNFLSFGLLSFLFTVNKTSTTCSKDSRFPGSNEKSYTVDFKYVFHHADNTILAKVENRILAKKINLEYIRKDKIKKIDVINEGERIIYTFSGEDAYLSWEQEMVLSRVINRSLCFRIDSSEALCDGINKVVYLHVRDEKKWS